MCKKLLLVITLSSCSMPVTQPESESYRYIWDAMWDLLDERYDTGNSKCYDAFDATTFVVTTDDHLSNIGCARDVTGCVIRNYPPDVPLGAYTVGLLEGQSQESLCKTVIEELVHIGDGCLHRNLVSWPFPGKGHPNALFGHDQSIQRELERRILDICKEN